MGVVNFPDGLGDFRGTKFRAFKGIILDATTTSIHEREFFLRDGGVEQSFRIPNGDFRVRPGSIVSVVQVEPPGTKPVLHLAKNHDTGQQVVVAPCPVKDVKMGGGLSKWAVIFGTLMQIAWFFKETSYRTWHKGGMVVQSHTQTNDSAIVIGIIGLILMAVGAIGWLRRSSHNNGLLAELQEHQRKVMDHLDHVGLETAAAE